MAAGIYLIKSPSNKVYVGSSKNIEKRWRYYKNNDCKSQRKLYHSLIKHGSDKHQFLIIEECLPDNLLIRESYWQKEYDSVDNGLNCVYENGCNKSKKLSKETRARISDAKKGIASPRKGIKTNKVAVNAKIVVDLNNGVFYESVKEASFYSGIKRTTLSAMLCGQNNNKTSYILI